MVGRYVFNICPEQPRTISYRDCKKCCVCNVSLGELKALYDKRVRDICGCGDSTLETVRQLRLEKAQRKFEPMAVIAELYEIHYKDNWETCLSRKENLHDCVYGCYSGISDAKQPLLHPHQRRNYRMPRYRGSFIYMKEKIADSAGSQKFNDFEDIIRYLEKIRREDDGESYGFGALSIYDTALRLAWHAGSDREKLLPKKVWLHQGAHDGAKYLHKLGLLSQTVRSLKSGSDAAVFPEQISRMEPHHIENLLCIFHPLFEDWLKAESSQAV